MRIVLSCWVVLGLMGSIQAQPKPVGVPYGSAIDGVGTSTAPTTAAPPSGPAAGPVPYSSFLSPGASNGQPYTPFVSDPSANSTINPYATPSMDANPDAGPGPGQSMSRMWVNADYAVMFIKRQAVIPLIETFPDSYANTPNNIPAGATQTLYPKDNQIRYNALNGIRASAGLWFDQQDTLGMDINGFVLEEKSNGASLSSDGSPILSRAYYGLDHTTVHLQFATPNPNGYAGTVSATNTLSSTYGFDMNVRMLGNSFAADRTDYLAGFRFFDFREQMDLPSHILFPTNPVVTLDVNDHFSTSNQFYGVQLGIDSKIWNHYGFTLEGMFKFAFGAMDEKVTISGFNTYTTNGVADTQVGGLYARPSNIGNYERSKVSILPELALTLSYNFTKSSSIYFGYNLLYVSNIMRPGNTIDPYINDKDIRYVATPTTTTDSPRPHFFFNGTDLWLQGLTFGYRFEY